MSTFLGWNIVTMPTDPGAPSSVEWTMDDTVAVSTSPFTQQQQIQNWQGSILAASVTMPPLTNAQAQAWIAWLMSCQGTASVFTFGDPLAIAPVTGVGTGALVVNGANQTGYQLSVTGYTGTLSPGDWIRINLRLYRNLTPVVMTGSAATLNIWPQIRESPADATGIAITNTYGIFRLAKNQRKYSMSRGPVYGISFDIREAI